MNMTSYRVMPIPAEICEKVRKTMVSPQYPSLIANVDLATGYGPCRSCLKVFDEGKARRICFTYNSFEGRSKLPDPGPIFIHEDACEGFADVGFPADLLGLPVLLEAFGDKSSLLSRQTMVPENVDVQIEDIFADDGVNFINIRNSDAGCFIGRVERLN